MTCNLQTCLQALWLMVFLTVGIPAICKTEKAFDGYTIWNADNIPMVYTQDSTQFVCDPDHILTEEYKDSANNYLHRMKMEMDIQTVFIIAHHVKNGDAFRMAQDVGNRYGVGYKDTRTGLVIVIATDDKQYFIAPGSGLEPYRCELRKDRPQLRATEHAQRQPQPGRGTDLSCHL